MGRCWLDRGVESAAVSPKTKAYAKAAGVGLGLYLEKKYLKGE